MKTLSLALLSLLSSLALATTEPVARKAGAEPAHFGAVTYIDSKNPERKLRIERSKWGNYCALMPKCTHEPGHYSMTLINGTEEIALGEVSVEEIRKEFGMPVFRFAFAIISLWGVFGLFNSYTTVAGRSSSKAMSEVFKIAEIDLYSLKGVREAGFKKVATNLYRGLDRGEHIFNGISVLMLAAARRLAPFQSIYTYYYATFTLMASDGEQRVRDFDGMISFLKRLIPTLDWAAYDAATAAEASK